MLITKQTLHHLRAGSSLQSNKSKDNPFKITLPTDCLAWTPPMMRDSYLSRQPTPSLGASMEILDLLFFSRKKRKGFQGTAEPPTPGRGAAQKNMLQFSLIPARGNF